MFGSRNHIHLNGDNSGEDSRVTIRALVGDDAHSLRDLTERDTARTLPGEVVGAERDGRLLAALSLSSGDVVADPFHPTADLVALLRVRAGQMLPPPA